MNTNEAKTRNSLVLLGLAGGAVTFYMTIFHPACWPLYEAWGVVALVASLIWLVRHVREFGL
jgi:tetrahydromethanopterin S-methyltransferase subunit C